jgi:serine/threonine-protein kinase
MINALRRVPLLARISIALALVAILPLGYAVWSLYDVNRTGMQEQVLRTHTVAASTAAERIAGAVKMRRDLARSIAANAAIAEDPRSDASRAFLGGLLAADSGIEILEILTPANEVVIRAQRRGAAERAGAIPEDAPAVWKNFLLVAEPLAENRGTLRIIADASAITGALDPAEIGDQAQMVLASRDDKLLAGSSPLQSFPAAMITAARTTRVNGTGVYRDKQGHTIMGAFAPVDGTPWFVLSRQPSAIAQRISFMMRQRAMLAVLVAILLAALLVLIANRTVIIPIRSVIRAQQKLMGQTPIPVGNEIDQLRVATESIHRRIADQEELGRVFLGRYQVLGIIGQGGMGTVFRGWDPKLRRHVALKTVHLAALTGHDAAGLVDSLIAEAITVASVSHPNIVSVFDVEDSTSAAFIAMELVDGVSLQSYLDQRERLTAEQTILVGLAIARALEAAHLRDVLHHDIKPANVLLGFDGAIKVADFGLAALINNVTASQDMVFGTPGYIAPEAATGVGRDARTDLFALGVVLYQCVTGQNPFEREDSRATMIAAVMTNPPALAERVEGGAALESLSRIVHALMAKAPEERPNTASEAAAHFETLVHRYRLQWKLDANEGGAPLHTGHGSATLVPTIAMESYSR